MFEKDLKECTFVRTWTPPCWPSAWTCRRRCGRGCRSRGARKTRRTPPRPATSRTRLRTQPDPRTIIQPVFVLQAEKQCSGSVTFWCGSGSKSSVTFRMQKDQFFHIFSCFKKLNLKASEKKCLSKFDFATIISVYSTLACEKSRIRIRTCD